MRFNSHLFLVYLVVVVVVLWLLPARARKVWLLLASYVFYASWGPSMLGLLVGSATLNYFGARWIAQTPDRYRRGAVIITGNVALLATFKYLGWLDENVNSLLSLLGIGARLPVPRWALPLGISFYLFESISYIADITRKRERPRSFLDLQLFIAFFPKLLAGPILRGKEFFPQLELTKRPGADDIRYAMRQIAIGLFFKTVLVERPLLGIASKVDEAFARPLSEATSIDAWIMALAFSVQLYFDFSAYTRIALGAARLCGVTLVENFNHPFMSSTPAEFWQRWHMSLSRWVRDYLYFPLQGGLEGTSRLRTAWAAFASMLVFGVWHGAGWNFVAFGAYQGVMLAAYYAISPLVGRVVGTTTAAMWIRKIGGWAITTGLFCLGAILWRCRDISVALGLFHRALAPWAYPGVNVRHIFVAKTLELAAFVMIAGLIHVMLQRRPAAEPMRPAGRYAVAALEGVFLAVLFVMSLVHMRGSASFVYFQF